MILWTFLKINLIHVFILWYDFRAAGIVKMCTNCLLLNTAATQLLFHGSCWYVLFVQHYHKLLWSRAIFELQFYDKLLSFFFPPSARRYFIVHSTRASRTFSRSLEFAIKYFSIFFIFILLFSLLVLLFFLYALAQHQNCKSIRRNKGKKNN